jgi:membrane protein YdbS with pleckstrin-like domain
MINQIPGEFAKSDTFAFLKYYIEQNEKAHRRTVRFATWGAIVALCCIAAMIWFCVTILSKRIESHYAVAMYSGFTGIIVTLYIYNLVIRYKHEQYYKYTFLIEKLTLTHPNLDNELMMILYMQMSLGVRSKAIISAISAIQKNKSKEKPD